MPFFLQEMLSSAPHPTPLRQAPKAPCCSEPACGSRPLESDPRLGLGTDRAERGGSRQGARPGCPAPGAACRGGGGPRGLSLSAPAPSPNSTPLLPPARSPPSAAPPPPPPAGAGPEPPRQPASERSALGWDSEEAEKEETAAAPRASSSAPTSDSRGEPWLSERRGGQRRRPGRLRPCLASQAPAAAAGERGALSPGPCLAPQPRGADRQTDRQAELGHPRTRARPKARALAHAAPRGPSRRTPPPAPGPWLPTPRGRGREGGWRCGTPPVGASWAALAGRAPRAP